jgi:hypothetical protein
MKELCHAQLPALYSLANVYRNSKDMKSLIIPAIFCLLMTACSRVTTKPDTQTTTSGTLGSVKATNQLPNDPVDTTLQPGDTVNIVRDSLP